MIPLISDIREMGDKKLSDNEHAAPHIFGNGNRLNRVGLWRALWKQHVRVSQGRR
jgi:hypothetical protein